MRTVTQTTKHEEKANMLRFLLINIQPNFQHIKLIFHCNVSLVNKPSFSCCIYIILLGININRNKSIMKKSIKI